MKITNHIQQHIRTLFVIMSVLIMAWGNVNEVKGQSITPDGIYPSAYAALASLLPTDMWDVVYDASGKATCDKLLIVAILPEPYASALGFEVGIPYLVVFEHNKNLKYNSTPGSEEWYVSSRSVKLTENTIISSGVLNKSAGQVLYYAPTNYTGGMNAFGFPYITASGIIPASASALITPKLPSDYLQTIYDTTNKATMDGLFTAVSFNETETAIIKAGFGITLPANKSCIFPFCKVIYFDGQEFYVPTNVSETSKTNYILDDVHNKNFYFTGTVDEACAGVGKESEGFIHIKGTDTEKADVYLDNFTIEKVKDKSIELSFNDIMSSGLPGMAAPFAISSEGYNKNNPMEVAFHIRGNNKLVGGARTNFTMKTASGSMTQEEQNSNLVFSMLLYLLNMNASPITVRPEPTDEGIDGIKNKTCSLTFDDKWIKAGTEIRTNGKLNLPTPKTGREAPAINLGNAYGRCTFNGGQYKLATAVSNNMFYVSSMSIAYRMVDILGIKIYGLGTTMATPATDQTVPYTLKINDGTFSVYSAEDIKDSIDVVGHGWYKAYDDMRFPIKTIIDGGSFNSYVYACDASAEQGTVALNSNKDPLCRAGYEVGAPDAVTGLSPLDLSEYPYYGTTSLTPVQEGDKWWVYPYLPGTDCEDRESEHIYNWVAVIPQMGASMMNVTMGGDVKVLTEDPNSLLPRKNNYFFYTRLNNYTKLNGTVEIAGLPIPIYKAIELGGEYEFTQVTNTENYKIEHGLYTMLSFESNKWYTICPPYDVHNIYVIETLPDEKLAEHGLTKADKGTSKYLKAQGKCDAVLAQGVVTSLLPDILSKKGSGVGMNLIDICRKTLGIEPYKITHYNPALPGHSSKEANYYLYEQVQDAEDEQGESEFPGAWTKANNLEDYSEKWKYATPVEGNTYTDQDGNTFTAPILMQRDSVYSILLPAGNDKYWDGKYLIFEGYGPQELHGTTEAEDYRLFPTILDTYEYSNDQFFLAGNGSFTNLHITSDELDWDERIYLPSTDGLKHDFVRANVGDSILPWQAYLAMNGYNTETYATLSALSPSKATMQAAPAAEDLTQTPLVQECSLMAYNQNGIMMQAYAQQMIAVYSVDGSLIWKGALNDGDRKHLSVPTGVYIIQGEQETTKIVVRE